MKLKYYLRGMGIGIIVTTIILAISFSQRKVEISDEQVMVRATALGMVMPDEQETDAASTETETEAEQEVQIPENVQTEEPIPEGTEAAVTTEVPTADGSETGVIEEPVAENGTYRLVINKGDVCRVVCEKLEENGVIDDAEALRTHLFELGYANNISTGAYDVPYGLTMEEVAQIIVTGPID